jgi:hypothetical protein
MADWPLSPNKELILGPDPLLTSLTKNLMPYSGVEDDTNPIT